MLGLGLSLGMGETSVGLPVIAGYRPLFHLTPFHDEVKTFSRASTATYIADDGDIESAAVNVLRNRDYSNGSAAILMEGQATNLTEYSGATVSDWTNSSSTLTQLSGDYLGFFSGVRVASTGAGWNRLSCGGVSWTAGQEYTVSVWYIAGTSGQVRVTVRDTAESIVSGVVGLTTVASESAGAISALSEVNVSGNVYRLTFSFTPNATAPSGTIGIGPNSGVAGEDIIALGAQFEEGESPTSYIPTSGAAATRGADISTVDVSGLDLSDGFWVVLKGMQLDGVDGGFDRTFQLDNGNGNNRLAGLYIESTSRIGANQYVGGVSQVSASETYSLGDKVTLAYKFREDDFAFISPSGVVTVGGTCSFIEPTNMYIAASSSSGSSKPARVSCEEIAIYPQDITPEEMKSALGL